MTRKPNPNGGDTTPRARWVVCGNFKDGSWNSQDLYAAVVSNVAVRVFFLLVAVKDLECEQFDFVTAFLNAGIPDDCEYFVEPPTGLNKPRGFVCKLRKALCGLRKSPIFWYETVRPGMERLGFTPVSADFCLLYHKD